MHAHPRTPPCHPSRVGFTLIELLTVIAVVGIMVAILIPIVGSVRQNARQSECASNLRQIMTAMYLYIGDNRGYMPVPSRVIPSPNNPSDTSNNSRWSRDLNEYLPQTRRAAATTQLWDHEIFVCPSAVTLSGSSEKGDIKMAYNSTQAMYGADGTSRFVARAVNTIASPARTLIVYDGKLGPTFEAQTNYYATWTQANPDRARDPEDMIYFSFRHKNRMNVAMVDGSVRSEPVSYLATLTQRRWQGLE